MPTIQVELVMTIPYAWLINPRHLLYALSLEAAKIQNLLGSGEAEARFWS